MWNNQGRPRKIHVKFPEVLVFGLGISEGLTYTILPNYQRWSFVLLEISRRYKEKPKQFQDFFQKRCILTPSSRPHHSVAFFLLE